MMFTNVRDFFKCACLYITRLIFITNTPELIKFSRGVNFGRYVDPMVELKSPADSVTTSLCQDAGYSTRGDKPPPSVFHSIATNQPNSIKSFDDGSGLSETRSGHRVTTHAANSNYSDYSHKSRIVGGGNVKTIYG